MAKGSKFSVVPQEAKIVHPQKPGVIATMRKPSNLQKRVIQYAAAAMRQELVDSLGDKRTPNFAKQTHELAEPALRFCLKALEIDGEVTEVTPENFLAVYDTLWADGLMVQDGIKIKVKDDAGVESEVSMPLDFAPWLVGTGQAQAFKEADLDPKESQPQ